MRCHKIHCQEPWFSLLKSGAKPVEGRKNSPFYSQIKVDDLIEFFLDDEKFTAKVIGINHYKNLRQYLETETLQRALPGVKTMEEGLSVYLAWNTEQEIEKDGFLGIQIKGV